MTWNDSFLQVSAISSPCHGLCYNHFSSDLFSMENINDGNLRLIKINEEQQNYLRKSLLMTDQWEILYQQLA